VRRHEWRARRRDPAITLRERRFRRFSTGFPRIPDYGLGKKRNLFILRHIPALGKTKFFSNLLILKDIPALEVDVFVRFFAALGAD
jgi:hypothetical protein